MDSLSLNLLFGISLLSNVNIRSSSYKEDELEELLEAKEDDEEEDEEEEEDISSSSTSSGTLQ